MYGSGGQTRGFINLLDTVRCIEIAALHPAKPGEFRVFNQFTEEFSVADLASKVEHVASSMGIQANISHLTNPRVESEKHYYHAAHTKLLELGLTPHLLSDQVIRDIIEMAQMNKDHIQLEHIMPTVTWS